MLATGRYAEGTTYAERARRLLEGPHGTAADRADVLKILGALYMLTYRLDEAAACLQVAVREAESAYGPRHIRVAQALRVYARVLRRQKHNNEAKSIEKRARQILAAAGTGLQNTVDVTAFLPKVEPRPTSK